jgi:hypothetical protein
MLRLRVIFGCPEGHGWSGGEGQLAEGPAPQMITIPLSARPICIGCGKAATVVRVSTAGWRPIGPPTPSPN